MNKSQTVTAQRIDVDVVETSLLDRGMWKHIEKYFKINIDLSSSIQARDSHLGQNKGSLNTSNDTGVGVVFVGIHFVNFDQLLHIRNSANQARVLKVNRE